MLRCVLADFPKYVIFDDGRIKGPSGKFLSPGKNKYGYHQYILYKNGKRVNKTGHQLVAQAFIPNPENKFQVNHDNGIKTDNRMENLLWSTPKENTQHAYKVLGIKGSQLGKLGKDNHRSKLVLQLKNGKIIKKWDSMSDAKREGFNHRSISRCCLGLRKNHQGFQWKFSQEDN